MMMMMKMMMEEANVDEDQCIRVACLLLENGADPTTRNNKRYTPLDLCKSDKVKSAVEKFIENRLVVFHSSPVYDMYMYSYKLDVYVEAKIKDFIAWAIKKMTWKHFTIYYTLHEGGKGQPFPICCAGWSGGVSHHTQCIKLSVLKGCVLLPPSNYDSCVYFHFYNLFISHNCW